MASQEELEQLFRRRGIAFEAPGFYDEAAFRVAESEDRRFLENYGEYVDVRRMDETYLNTARVLIPEVTNFLAAELTADGRTGACIDVSGVLMRILERERIWSCMIGGAVTITFPPSSGLTPARFAPIMLPSNSARTGHMWLFAPPYKVVDITLSLQPWRRGQSEYIPPVIVSENWEPATADIYDLMESQLIDRQRRDTRREPTLADLSVGLLRTMDKFPPFSIIEGSTEIKYAPTQISAMDNPLEQMRNLQLSGRLPAELYQIFLQNRVGIRPESHG